MTTARKRHTDRAYEAQLRTVRERLLLMAARVEEMIDKSVQALAENDVALARATIAADAKVNTAEIENDELCLVILAKRQPMASDLRFITLALKAVTDLERIGDLAVNVCERAIDLADTPPLTNFNALTRMAEVSRGMVHDAIDAFVEGDADRAREVIERDDEVDKLYEQVFHEMLEKMVANPDVIHRGIHLQSVAKWLERIADHATNLAEQIIFMVEGRDVRHVGKLDR